MPVLAPEASATWRQLLRLGGEATADPGLSLSEILTARFLLGPLLFRVLVAVKLCESGCC